ncbi:eukaryotic translation initiation factor 4B isoform X2 [Coregonus clupeaformis]|uniref:eukaryotic translation initiation factor 4B isoform X2 n=1 Tax=Coregonus clupeaformis TaxID=59861 RepID=UPI001BE0326A|nr:eukaryotic translation initiation factor 4B isoform X2 [Coregonus clupeaformis]
MAAAAKKKGNKKGKTLTLTDFLAEDSGSGGNAPPPQPSYAKSTSWADETDDLEGDVSTSWHTGEDSYRAPAIDRNILPTAPRSAREPDVDRSRLPRSPPYTAFLGNLPYDVSEESIKDFFRGLAISAVRLPREPSNPERLKGFGYAEFDDVDSLLRALTLNEENLGNRRIRVDIADQSNDKEGRDNGQMGGRDRMGRMGDMGGPEKTDSDDWRARPTADADDGPPKREESAFGSRDRYGDRDGPRRENDRGFGGDRDRGFGGDRDRGFGGDRDRGFGGDRDSGRDRGRDRYDDRGAFGSRRDRDDGGRRAFGSGYRRDDDYQSGGGGGSRYGDRDRYGGDREDRYERQDEGSEERREGGPTERPKLVLKPRSMPKEVEQAGGGGAPPAAPAAARSSGRASIFGGAKPVDTAAKEREVEEKLQRQLEEDKSRGFERKPRDRDRDPSWRNEEPPSERSRTGSESSQPGSTSGGRASRRRESERSVENEVFSGKEDDPPSLGACPSSANSSTFSSKEPLKVMPAPPPKENAWAKRPVVSAGSSEGRSPISPSDAAPPKLSSSSANERGSGKDENKVDGVRLDRGPPRGRGGAAGPGAGRGRGEGANRNRRREEDRKDKRRSRDSRPAPEPKKYEESPTLNFSSASKYAALLMDGEQGDDAENGVE